MTADVNGDVVFFGKRVMIFARTLGDGIRCVVLATVVFTMGCGVTGCGVTADPPAKQKAASVVIVDRLDRRVAVGDPATRIVSLTPASTELLFALELGPSVVGATSYCNYPPAALKIPRVGSGTLESLSLESIISAKPDLVLCKADSHEPLVDSLDRMNIPVLAIEPQSMQELFEEARWIGQLTGRETEAEAFIKAMTLRREHLSKIVERVQPNPPLKVFYEVWDDPLMTAGSNSFINEILTLAGLENIIADTSVRYPRISVETVLQGQPDLIFLPTTDFEQSQLDRVRLRPGWQSIPAVANHRIYQISADEVSRCGPRLLDALEQMIRAAYPNVSPEELRFDSPSANEEAGT